MTRLVGWTVVVVLAVGCDGEIDPPAIDAAVIDAAVVDAPVDAPDDAPVDAAVITAPPQLFQTAGGGSASSASYRVELRIGAPQPMGTASSAGFRVRLGPTTP
jgi:hypothetical protein